MPKYNWSKHRTVSFDRTVREYLDSVAASDVYFRGNEERIAQLRASAQEAVEFLLLGQIEQMTTLQRPDLSA